MVADDLVTELTEFVAVTNNATREPTNDSSTTNGASDAPAISTHDTGNDAADANAVPAGHEYQSYDVEGAGKPVHVPAEAVNVSPK